MTDHVDAEPEALEPTGDVEETLAWERQHGQRAAIAAAIAAIATLIGGIISSTALNGQPHVALVTSLQNSSKPGADTRTSLRTPQLEYLHDHASTLILGGVVLAIGYFALIPTLGFLYRATKARRPEFPRAVLVLALIGPALLGVAAIVFQVALTVKAGDFVNSSNHTRDAVDDVTNNGLLRGVQILNLPGTLCFAFALVLLGLNAMRVGLLTRFMGVLAIISGGALILLPQNPIIIFWLLAMAVLFARRWPSGMPPAWETGTAVPWPSATEVAEQRAAARGNAPQRDPEPDSLSESGPSNAHASSKKRKRKRRH
jgi:Domain of unknown function (DUF4386)